MIHELLFNLWNNPGSAVISDDNDWTHLFELPQFLHPAEETLLQMIIQIGADYHKITSFTNEILNESCITKADFLPNEKQQEQNLKIQNGLYLKAFCNGVQEALEDYRKEIIRLENTFLEYPQLSLSYVLSAVDQYKSLFSVLKSMIKKIQSENLYGCLLMSSLQKYITCGINQLEKAASIILKAVNTVFYQHLCNWIICGDLVDPYNEFFVCDGKVPDENFLYPEQLGGNTTRLVNKIKQPPLVRKFYINWDMVPKFISEDSAESILFMGRIVWILRNDPKRMEYSGDYQTKFRRDIWEGKEIEYYNKIRSVGDQSLNAGKFRTAIEECRSKLTKYLWSVMLKEGNLIEHLKLIREYYALGRGELFQQFLAVSNLKEVPPDSVLQHINVLFHETARKIYGENDKSYLRFELTFSGNGEVSNTKFWQCLHLNFEVQWPLHIIFHPEVIGFYNKLFSFLLRLKKTQVSLFKLWAYHTFSKHKIDRRVWMLRQNLLFLVDNLQYYIQVNVIEAQFSTLMKAVESASEFEDVIKIHHEFVTNLLAETFLLSRDEPQESSNKHRLYQMPALQHSPPSNVYNAITRLLELCDDFCFSAKTWNAEELCGLDLEEFDTFQKRTDIIIDTLLVLLYSLHGKVRGNHLLQLVLHLDLDKYFSRNKTDLSLHEAFRVH